jgi:hypothetical protein
VQPAGGHKPYKGRLRVDSGFYLELQFCYEQGIPHSKLLQWDPVDRAKLLAFVTERGTRCVMCGTADWEWDPKQGGNRRAYEPVEKFCPGCYAKASARTADTGRNMDGITIELARNDNSVETLKRHALQRKLAKSS